MRAFTHIRPHASARGLRAFVLVVCLVILGLEGWRDWHEREQEFARIQSEMKNLAKSLSQHAEDIFNLADAILVDVVDRIETGGATPAVIAAMDGFFTERIQTLQSVKSLTVYGEDGLLLSSSLPGHRYKVNAQEQAFFQHHKNTIDGKLRFGSLIRDPLGSDWVLTVSRRLAKPNGTFAGVVQISIPPRYFANFFGRFDIGSQGTVALLGTDGTLLSRYPYLESAIGVKQAFSAWAESGRVPGFGEYVSPIDGVARFASVQRNHIYPVMVLAAVGQEEALKNWNEEFVFRTVAIVILVILIGTLGWNLAGELRRREAAEAELAVLATTDGLTSLANRRTFDRRLETEWLRAAREKSPVSLLLVDVDQFKAYNDIYGHQAGDSCLQEVARTIAGAARRPADLVARYGGEELVVLLPGVDESGAAVVAEEIRAKVEALTVPHEANAPIGILTVSVGSATRVPSLDRSRMGPKDLITLADAALYRAKQGGRNRVATAQAA
ncbi:sensor domain-containing diguanylate cyclase [Microvirga arsenatis]|uniref:diguanylate cyclase n=1 Tax=Microvirga arsenatis TaxID=2692265 RepID=A0ABW9YYV9_9HYPH|nr:sensor domain-containing diguanylate cyclase [Microvirga arsenatis]NBJ11219.1 diguanylate cyclase [Microvirga arsenatis]NBJ25492.1 diguanylate cyclase [Microvirga arsenatis]